MSRVRAAGAGDEPFKNAGRDAATLAGGTASTENLRLESKDLLLAAGGTVQAGRHQHQPPRPGAVVGRALQTGGARSWSATHSRRARDAARDDHRFRGVAAGVRIDVADVAKRALTNRASEEAQKAIRRAPRAVQEEVERPSRSVVLVRASVATDATSSAGIDRLGQVHLEAAAQRLRCDLPNARTP